MDMATAPAAKPKKRFQEDPLPDGLARQIELVKAANPRIPMRDIQHYVASYFRLSVGELTDSRMFRRQARPRQLAMFLCRHLTPRSYPEIGRMFGGRNHTTVMHACAKVSKEIAFDGEFYGAAQYVLNFFMDPRQ
jgi:chromosomal replication initiation ATPase DnaA